MRKKNKKLLAFSIILFVIVVVISFIAVPLIFQNTVTSYFLDKDLGIITLKVSTQNIVIKFLSSIIGFFQQAVTFSQTTIEVNNPVSFTDSFTVTELTIPSTNDFCNVGYVDIIINKPTGTLAQQFFYEPTLTKFQTSTKTSSFTPTATGVYSATSIYHEVTCNVLTGTNCQSTTVCPKTWTQQSTNSVTVTNNENCNKNDYCDNFVSDHTIDGGTVDKALCYKVDNSCNYIDDTPNYRTTCDDNHYITGTESHGPANGQLTCSLIPSGNDCTITGCNETGKACNTASKACESSACNTDLTETCWDNSTITTKTCVITSGIGVLQDTNNSCPVNVNQKSEYFRLFNNSCTAIQLYINETTTNDYSTMPGCQAKMNVSSTNNTGNNTYTTCWTEKSLWKQAMNMSEAFIGNRTICDSKPFMNVAVCPVGWQVSEQACETAQPQKINWILWLSISGIIILIIFIIGIILYKRKR